MSKRKHISMILAVCCLGLVVIAVGCKRKPAPAEAGEQQMMFLNDRCPMDGVSIDTANVPENLTCPYQDGKVAFCCSNCREAWMKLSEVEKLKKLNKAITE